MEWQDMTIPPIVDEFDEDEEFVFTVPEGGEDDDEIVYPILPKDEAHAILDAEEEDL